MQGSKSGWVPVVLQDDALLHLFEKQAAGAAHPQAAALVHIGIVALDHLPQGVWAPPGE